MDKDRMLMSAEYRFYPLNHSVARAGFGNQLPCIPYEDDGPPNLVGFWSGFQPVAAVLSNVSMNFSSVSFSVRFLPG
jgi:hypothetical protein